MKVLQLINKNINGTTFHDFKKSYFKIFYSICYIYDEYLI